MSIDPEETRRRAAAARETAEAASRDAHDRMEAERAAQRAERAAWDARQAATEQARQSARLPEEVDRQVNKVADQGYTSGTVEVGEYSYDPGRLAGAIAAAEDMVAKLNAIPGMKAEVKVEKRGRHVGWTGRGSLNKGHTSTSHEVTIKFDTDPKPD